MTEAYVGTIDGTCGAAAAPPGAVSLDGGWIVGDVRLDARRDLAAALRTQADQGICDLGLVWHAYAAWGDTCVDHLAGEFSFALWDERRRRLFAARDQLGIRPFYYAAVRHRLVFGNTLAGVRRGAQASRLDEVAVGDFLLFDAPVDLTRTMFADVRRLAPGHVLAATPAGGVRTSRYWSLPIDEPLRLRRAGDYVDAFREVIGAAVADRLDPRGVGVFMSGGIDSTTLAATATALGGKVRAFAWVEDAVDGGVERRGATAAAAHLGIDLDVHEPDAQPIDRDWEEKPLGEVEPTPHAWQTASVRAYHRRIAATRELFFHGEGPDNALYYEWRPYLSHLLRTGQVAAIGVDGLRYLSTLRRIPLLDGVLAIRRRRRGTGLAYPRWLQPEFERDAGLADRWTAVRQRPSTPRHPTRPGAYASLQSPLWQQLFEAYDPERSGAAFTVRHPFLDLRVLRFMLSVPVIPWCREKLLLRRAMCGALPQVVLTRRKRGYRPAGRERIERELAGRRTRMTPALSRYVDAGAFAADPLESTRAVQRVLRVKSLNRWLRDLEHCHDA